MENPLDRVAVVLVKKRVVELAFENNVKALIFSWCALHERFTQLQVQSYLDGIVTENIQIARPFGEPSHSRQGVLERIQSLPKDSQHAHHVQKFEIRRPNNGQMGKFRAEILYQAVDSITGKVINGVLGYDAKVEPHDSSDLSSLAKISEIKVSLLDRLGSNYFETSYHVNRANSVIYYWIILLQQNQKESMEKIYDPNQRDIQHQTIIDVFSEHWDWWKELESVFILCSITANNVTVNVKEGKEDEYEVRFSIHFEGLNSEKKPQETVIQVYWVLHEDFERWPKIRVSRNSVKSLSSMDLESHSGNKRKNLQEVVSDDAKIQRNAVV
eukprot:TRINITY_DN4885_c0_g1_i1.p1 TRINITY_DN4885_c0_g1~~TRINITY_DN4885_c0_g1_i1.p1  ORF type:complete len:328 (+),score=86.15 TRINITY_DN4885_c0_g1_i1:239-1222(+)